MTKALIVGAVVIGAVVLARHVLSRDGSLEGWIERMPDNAPPKWAFQNISAIRENTAGSWNSSSASTKPTRVGQQCLCTTKRPPDSAAIGVVAVPPCSEFQFASRPAVCPRKGSAGTCTTLMTP